VINEYAIKIMHTIPPIKKIVFWDESE